MNDINVSSNNSKLIEHNIKVYYKKNKNKKMVSDEIIQTFNILDKDEKKEKEKEKEIEKEIKKEENEKEIEEKKEINKNIKDEIDLKEILEKALLSKKVINIKQSKNKIDEI